MISWMAPDGFHPSVVFDQPTNQPINQRLSVYSILRFLKSPTSIATKHTYHFKWLREKHIVKKNVFHKQRWYATPPPPQKNGKNIPTTNYLHSSSGSRPTIFVQFSVVVFWIPTKLFSTGNEESRSLAFFSMFKTPGYPQKSHWKSAILKNSEEWQASPVQNPSRFLQMRHNNWLMYPLGN